MSPKDRHRPEQATREAAAPAADPPSSEQTVRDQSVNIGHGVDGDVTMGSGNTRIGDIGDGSSVTLFRDVYLVDTDSRASAPMRRLLRLAKDNWWAGDAPDVPARSTSLRAIATRWSTRLPRSEHGPMRRYEPSSWPICTSMAPRQHPATHPATIPMLSPPSWSTTVHSAMAASKSCATRYRATKATPRRCRRSMRFADDSATPYRTGRSASQEKTHRSPKAMRSPPG